MPPLTADFEGLLRAFAARDVRFVVIGGVSAAMQGVPAVTYDLDLVLDPEGQSLDRAHEVMVQLEACFREHLPKRLEPRRQDLESDGALLLLTRLGPLDLLGEVSTGWRYPELITRARNVRVADDLEVRLSDTFSGSPKGQDGLRPGTGALGRPIRTPDAVRGPGTSNSTSVVSAVTSRRAVPRSLRRARIAVSWPS